MAALNQSRYNIMVPLLRDRVLIYNSMSGASAVLESKDAELLHSIESLELDSTEAGVSDLVRGGFVVAGDTEELEILREQYNAQRYDPNAMILTIAPTLGCNFGCDYCFQGQDKPVDKMSEEVQEALFKLVGRAAPNINRLHVAWYGGEPLLGLSIIERLSDRFIALCDLRGIKYDAMIVTNGFRLTPDVARSLHVRRVKSAQVTLDGAAPDHDQRRTLLGGQPTFRRIVENLLEVVEEVPIRLSIRINIDDRNAARVRELLSHLHELGLSRRSNFGVYFAPVEAITQGCHVVANVCLSKSDYGQLETELTRHAYDLGLTSLPYPPRFRGICGAVRPKSFVVAPNGDLHKCWDTISFPTQKVGTIFDLDALRTDERVLKWVQWTPFENDVCTNCKLLPNCTGSCAHKFVNSSQTLGEAGSLPCPSWKYNIKEKLVLHAERSGAISAADYDPANIRTDPVDICPKTHSMYKSSFAADKPKTIPLRLIGGS